MKIKTMKKIILLLLMINSISYSQNTTMHFYYGTAKNFGGEVLFQIRGTESTYLGGGFSGAYIKDKFINMQLT